MDSLLSQRCTPQELRHKTHVEHIKHVYKYSLEYHFEPSAEARDASSSWLVQSGQAVQSEAVPTRRKLCTDYWKSTLTIGAMCTMLLALFETSMLPFDPSGYSAFVDPASGFLELALQAPAANHGKLTSVLFDAVQLCPEGRSIISAPHEVASKSSISVRRSKVLQHVGDQTACQLQGDSSPFVCIWRNGQLMLRSSLDCSVEQLPTVVRHWSLSFAAFQSLATIRCYHWRLATLLFRAGVAVAAPRQVSSYSLHRSPLPKTAGPCCGS